MKIKSLPKIDLPREKLEKYGPRKLAKFELLAVILGSGIKGLNVLDLSKKIVKILDKHSLVDINIEKLISIRGLGKAKSLQVLALLELSKRIYEGERVSVKSGKDIWQQCFDFYNSKKEHFVAFYLDSQNNLIERKIISIGILDSTLIHPREIFEPAIKLLASNIIIVHNHPSGQLKPSQSDLDITNRVIEAGKILGINILDHIIVSEKNFFSFKDEGVI
jgi:DNA repair protein RadC